MNRTPIHSILSAVAKSFGVSVRQMASPSRRNDIVLARACYSNLATSAGFTLDFTGHLISRSKQMVSIYQRNHEYYLSIPEYRRTYNVVRNDSAC